jgi:hypothetical protein
MGSQDQLDRQPTDAHCNPIIQLAKAKGLEH